MMIPTSGGADGGALLLEAGCFFAIRVAERLPLTGSIPVCIPGRCDRVVGRRPVPAVSRPTRQYTVTNLHITAEDLDLFIPHGAAFAATVGGGTTALVVIGARGDDIQAGA